MQRKPEYVIEREYHGYDLYTDGKLFFAKDDGGKPIAEAKSLDAVKAQLLKAVPVDIQAVIVEPWSYYSDGDDQPAPQKVRIYAVSGAGAILYEEEDGSKRKASVRHSGLRRFIEANVEEYINLKTQQAAIKKKLDRLLKDEWKELGADDVKPCPGSAK